MAPGGLFRHDRPHPLLKHIGGVQRATVSKSLEEPEDVTAPPIESSESEDEGFDPIQRYQDSSDDDGEPARGAMVRCGFGPKKASTTTTTVGNEGRGERPQLRSARSNKKRAANDLENADAGKLDIFSSGKKAKTSGGNGPSNVGIQMRDGYRVERKPLKPGFGKNAKKSKNADSSRDSTPRRNFEKPRSMSASTSPEKAKTFTVTQLEPGLSSPAAPKLRYSKTSKARVQSDSSELSELSELESSVCSDPPRPLKSRKTEQPNRRQPRKARKIILKELSPEDIPQRPKFKMPEGYDDFATQTEPARVNISTDEDSPAEKGDLGPGKGLCPMCDEPVDKQWMSDFSRNKRMSIARQAKFCQQHKKRSAKETWAEKGYPDISWDGLEARIARQHGYLKSLINGKASHFGEVLEEKIQTGKNRTLLKTEDYLTPGYYGLRGMSIMTETIVEMFSALLRERAPRYKLISARGYTGFVQSVLVPELAVKLIQEDLSLEDDEAARLVMEESRAIGEILNDEKRESQSQRRVDLRGVGEAVAAEGKQGKIGKASGGDQDISVALRMQEVDDSESDLSSLASSGGKKAPVDNKKKEVVDSDSDLSSLASSATKQPAGTKLVVVDSDSDLSSLADL